MAEPVPANAPPPPAHPRNRGFVWSAPAGPFRRLGPEALRAWNERGFLVLERALAPGEVAAAVGELDPLEARVEAFLRTRPDGRAFIARAGEITFAPHGVLHSAVLRRLVAHPVLVDLAHDLVGPDVRLYWDQSVYKKPGTEAPFPWHQDNGYTYVEPQQYLTCWIALTDATRENGCPWVVPGLHRRGTLAHRPTDLGWRCLEDDDPWTREAVAVEAPAGSVVVFSSLTPHRTGPNRSGAVRKAYIVQYAPAGAVAFRPGEAPARQDDPSRQFPVLAGGRPVPPPAGDPA